MKQIRQFIFLVLAAVVAGLLLYWITGEWESTKEFISSIPSAIASILTYGIPLWIVLILGAVIIILIKGYMDEVLFAGELEDKLKTDQDDPLKVLLDFTSTIIDDILVTWTYEHDDDNGKLIIRNLTYNCPTHQIPLIKNNYCSICKEEYPTIRRMMLNEDAVIQQIQHVGMEWIKAKESQAD